MLYLEVLAPQYISALKAEIAAVNRPKAFSETPEMVEVDRLRDHALSMIFNIVNAYLKSTRSDEIAAARRLHAVISPYHGAQGHEYNKETMELDGMLTSLSASPQEDITMLSLNSAIVQMNEHNVNFKRLMDERSGDVVGRTPVRISDTSELRHNLDAKYHQIVQTVNAFAIAIPSPELEKFTVEINAIIVQYKQVIAHQGKHSTEQPEAFQANPPVRLLISHTIGFICKKSYKSFVIPLFIAIFVR